MRDITKEITKEEFELYKDRKGDAYNNWLTEKVGLNTMRGYGLYWVALYKNGNGYWLKYTIGSSCD